MSLILLFNCREVFFFIGLSCIFSIQNEIEPPPIDTTWIETTSKKAALKVRIVIYNNFIWCCRHAKVLYSG